MCHRLIVISIVMQIITISVQGSCTFSCLSDALSDKNCMNKYDINAYTVLNETEGIVDLQFDFGCSVETYLIVIFYNKTTCDHIRQHAIYSFEKIQYSDENSSQLDKCEKRGTVLLQNIESGCYKIDILDEEYHVLYTNTYIWQTSYVRQELNASNTKTIHDSRNNGTELILTIENPILNSHPAFSLQFECENCPKYLSKEYIYNLIQDENDSEKLVLNPDDDNTHLNISCDLKRNIDEYGIASCVIFPVIVGHYNILITFIGDPYKCAYNKPENHVRRIKYIVVEADELLQQRLNYLELIVGPVLGIICILLSCFVITLVIKLMKENTKFDNDENNFKEHVNNNFEEPGAKSCVLLLYGRNSDDVMENLASFRNIFMYQGIQVFDIYDPERLSEINEHNFNWILNLIPRKDIKIIIFLTPNAQKLSDVPQVQNSIDTLFPFAMKHLLQQISINSDFYKKIFVAHFSNDVYEYSDYEVFCPYLRFRVPDDIMALLQTILNTKQISLNIKSNNEYHKLKYSCENCSQEYIINYM